MRWTITGLVPGAGDAQISSRHHGAGTSPTSSPQARPPKGERWSLRRSGHVPPKVVDTPLPRPDLTGAHLLGNDIATTIGEVRLAEFLARWPGDSDLLVRALEGLGGPAWPHDCQLRSNLLDALTLGLAPAPS
jgi:hypothetical protein